jgi:hypothetical protein
MEQERKTYLDNLRRDAYIEIAKDYREGLLPLLKVEPRKSASTATPAAATTTAAPKKDDKKKSEGNKKQ